MRVLVVEGDDRDGARLTGILEDGGYRLQALQVKDGPALDAALVSGAWDLVLLNSNLPGLAADEVLGRLALSHRQVPVLLVVDRGAPSFPLNLLENGARDFVLKSNPARLLPLVERECVLPVGARTLNTTIPASGSGLEGDRARFLQLAANIPECYWLADATSGRLTFVSEAYAHIWGRSVELLYADPDEWLRPVHPDDRERVAQALKRSAGGGLDEVFRVVRGEGPVRWLHARNFAIRDGAGEVVNIGGIASDVTSLLTGSRPFGALAHFDGLTALPNCLSFHQQAANLLALAKRKGGLLALVVVDIDRFRVVNQALGNSSGDELLRQVAGRLSGSLRESDIIGRLAGDVFAGVFSDLDDACQASVIARRIIDTLMLPVHVDGREIFATASVGIALFPQDGDSIHALLENAEIALRQAKQSGRNNYQFFSPNFLDQVRERLFLETDLRNAALRHEFVLFYQPKASCGDGKVIGAEALLRWYHPVRGIVPPDEFIGLLEETGLIVEVGRWALLEACRQAVAWQQAGLEIPGVAVNLSARQLQAETLRDDVANAIAISGIAPSCLELEITESMLMENAEQAVRILNTLKSTGVSISLDDFGTGYSSLAYLKRFPLDSIKVDRSFVQDITADSDDASITRAVITMAHHLKLKVVAEGVETAAQLALLVSHRCDIIQGYFFSRPLPVEEMGALLAADRRLPSDLLAPGQHTPTLLLAGAAGYGAVAEELAAAGFRVGQAADAATAVQWMAENLVDVVVAGTPRRGFDTIGLLQELAGLQPRCHRILLADDRHWRMAAVSSSQGLVHGLLRHPLDPAELVQVVRRVLLARAVTPGTGAEHGGVVELEREILHLEQDRLRLANKAHELQEKDGKSYGLLQGILSALPWPVIGVDDTGMVTLTNDAADREFLAAGLCLGAPLADVLPASLAIAAGQHLCCSGRRYRGWWKELGLDNPGRGKLLLLQQEENH